MMRGQTWPRPMGTTLSHLVVGRGLNVRDYYLGLQSAIHAAPHVLCSDVWFEEIDVNECYVRAVSSLEDSRQPAPVVVGEAR